MATERGVVFQYVNDCSLTVTVKHTRFSVHIPVLFHSILVPVLCNVRTTVWCDMGQPVLLCRHTVLLMSAIER